MTLNIVEKFALKEKAVITDENGSQRYFAQEKMGLYKNFTVTDVRGNSDRTHIFIIEYNNHYIFRAQKEVTS